MTGQLIQKKKSNLYAFYDDENRHLSDYDIVYPITLIETIHVSMDAKSKNLMEILIERDEYFQNQVDAKQPIIPAGEAPFNIVAYSGVEGKVNELGLVTKLAPNVASASNFKVPTELAVVEGFQGTIIPLINQAKTESVMRDNQQEIQMNTDRSAANAIRDRVDILEGEMDHAQADIDTNRSKVESVRTDHDALRKDFDKLKIANEEGLPKVIERIDDLEANALTEDSFGDKKYVKDITVENKGGYVLVTEQIGTVNEAPLKTQAMSFQSSDTTIAIELVPTANPDINIINFRSTAGPGEFDKKVDKNDDLLSVPVNGATKIKYDKKGLVIGSLPLEADDIPNVPQGKVLGLEDRLLNIEGGDINFSSVEEKINLKADQHDHDLLEKELDEFKEERQVMTMPETVDLWDAIFNPVPVTP
jgi:hypothetical protein